MSGNTGRPTVINPDVVSKLIASFHTGLNVREACWQSGISHEAYYQRLRKDNVFADTMAKAQGEMTSKAKKIVAGALTAGDLSTAKWWIEHRSRQNSNEDKDETSDIRDVLTESIATQEKLICLKYRAVLFNERQILIDQKIQKDPNIQTRFDLLLNLPNTKLIEHIELEIYATGHDKANVNLWLEHRRELAQDMGTLQV
ncbi:hypothetical protein D3C73_15770 [compost metagenome]